MLVREGKRVERGGGQREGERVERERERERERGGRCRGCYLRGKEKR